MTSLFSLKFTRMGILVSVLLLAACSSANLQETFFSNARASSPPGAVVQVALKLSQDLGIPIDEINIIDYERVDWMDACLGVEMEGEACVHGITPGYRVSLVANGESYEFHSDLEGKLILKAATDGEDIAILTTSSIQAAISSSPDGITQSMAQQMLPVSYWTIFISEDDQEMTLNCDGITIVVKGNNNTLTFLGSCSGLTVSGNKNQISVEPDPPFMIKDLGDENTIIER